MVGLHGLKLDQIISHSLYAWIKKYGPDSVEHNAKTDEQAEIRRLKKERKRTTELALDALLMAAWRRNPKGGWRVSRELGAIQSVYLNGNSMEALWLTYR